MITITEQKTQNNQLFIFKYKGYVIEYLKDITSYMFYKEGAIIKNGVVEDNRIHKSISFIKDYIDKSNLYGTN